MTKQELLGDWRILIFEAITGDRVSYPLGQRPAGYIGFSPTRFWVMLVDSDRKQPGSAARSDAEAIALMRSSAAYTGRYEVEETLAAAEVKVTIHVDAASNEALVKSDRVFSMRIDGQRLKLKSPAVIIPSGATSVV